eukprot:Opistho-1_new@932
MQRALAAAFALETCDDLLDLLAARPVGHEHRVRGLDDDHVIETDRADEPARRVDQRVAAVLDQRVAMRCVAMGVAFADLPHRVPRTEVAPAGVERHHLHAEAAGRVGRAGLHHRVVDRFAGDGGEGGLVGTHEAGVGAAAGPRGLGGLGDIRPEMSHCGEPHGGPQYEHAAVPRVAAVGEVALGGGPIGLLDEGLDAPDHVGAFAVDIAEAGLRAVGHDAERDEAAVRRGVHGLPKCTREGRAVGHGLVGRGDHEDAVVSVGHKTRQCRQGECGGRVAAGRLEQQRRLGAADLAQLLQQHEAVLLVADHQRRCDGRLRVGQGREPLAGLLEQRRRAGQGQELLRVERSAERPEPRAGAAGEHDGRDVMHGGNDEEVPRSHYSGAPRGARPTALGKLPRCFCFSARLPCRPS